MTLNRFDAMYDGTPPWEIGRAQGAVTELLARGGFRGRVLDVGCGTGENSLVVAATGLRVVGVDAAPRAIEIAKAKAKARALDARFSVHDALELRRLGATFDTVLDSGLFHTFTDAGRARYLASLSAVLRPGSSVHVLCFSDEEPAWGGPRRVTEQELRDSFAAPFAVESLRRTRFETRTVADGAHAWLATVVYVGRPVGTA